MLSCFDVISHQSCNHFFRFCSVLYGTPEHGQPIVGNGVILKEGFVDGERDFVEMTEKDQLTLVALMVSFGNVVLRPESEVS